MQSAQEWNQAADDKRQLAELAASKGLWTEVYSQSGQGCEFALKGAIHRKRYNWWPSRKDAPHLYTHDLRALLEIVMDIYGISEASLSFDQKANFKAACRWSRQDDYSQRNMSPSKAKANNDAVYGESGLVQWLETLT